MQVPIYTCFLHRMTNNWLKLEGGLPRGYDLEKLTQRLGPSRPSLRRGIKVAASAPIARSEPESDAATIRICPHLS